MEPTREASARGPLVSIIIPSFNQGRFIRETIESCLAQDYRPLEVIVIDGASTDETVTVLRSFDGAPEVRWVSERDSGVAEAVNKGLAIARGEIAGIQSSDDSYSPGAVSQAVKYFRESPDLSLVYSDWMYIDAEGKERRPYRTGPFSLENFLSTTTLIPQHAAFFKLDLARQVGGWDPDYFIADTEMWLRMVFRGKARKVDAFWGVRRMHDKQRNIQAAQIVESWIRMVEKSPDIARSPKRIRRAAKCGSFLAAARYNPNGSKAARLYYFSRAVLAFPEVYRQQKLSAALTPFYWNFKRGFGRLRSGLAKVRREA